VLLVARMGANQPTVWQMQTYALEHHLTPFISLQNHWNLIYREEEREMQPTLKHFGVGAIPYSPLGRGFLTRPWRSGSARQTKDGLGERFYGLDHAESEAIVGVVAKVAQAHGATMAQVALAWLLSKDAVAAPIVGTTTIESLKDLVGECTLSFVMNIVADIPSRSHAAEAHAGGDEGVGGAVQAKKHHRTLVMNFLACIDS
jgi:aryl-alcohol dehydrogenase-like predicted oxidoreductase